MPDQHSAMNEYRYLDEKRVVEGLTAEEKARHAQLRGLVGLDARSPAAGGGFDVNAAAAHLRESLLPAGLRNRPPPTPDATPAPAVDPQPGNELSAAEALASVHAAEPFDPLVGAPPAEADALFDPAQLGMEPAPGDAYFDPNVAQYDPNAAYDPHAQAAWDPNQPWDPAAAQEGGAAFDDPNAAYDPSAQAGWDPNQPLDPNVFQAEAAAQPYDPNAQPYDPNAQPYDPSAQPYDPSAQPYDPNAQPYDPSAQPYDPSAQPYDPNAQPEWDPNQAWDPNAFAAETAAQPYDPNAAQDANAPYDPNAQPYEPSAEPFQLHGDAGAAPPAAAWEIAAPGEGSSPEGGLAAAPWDAPGPAGIDAGAALEAAADAAFVPAEPVDAGLPVSPEPEPFGDDATAPAGWHAEPPPPEPSEAPLGEYDETGGSFAVAAATEAEALPFDASPASAVADGYVPAELAAPLGEYDDTAGFSGTEYALPELGALPGDAEVAPGGETAPQADVAADGFSLESGGSFGAHSDAAASAWAADSAAPPWENAPPFDLATPHAPPLDDGSGYELAPPDGETFAPPLETEPVVDTAPLDLGAEGAEESPALPPPGSGPAPELDFSQPDFSSAEDAFVDAAASLSDLHAEPASAPFDAGTSLDEEIPTIEATDILEEVPEESPAPPPRSLDFEPLAPAAAAPEPRLAAAADVAAADVLPGAPPSAPPQASSPPAAAAAAPAAPPAPAPFPVAGTHRVVVHTVEGLVKRGVLEDADLASPAFTLHAQAGQPGEEVATENVKAIFFMLASGEKAPAPEGKKVRVTFRDGRQVAGFSPDYEESGVGFFMIPGDTRTNTGRIWVYRSAVRQVTVS